MMEGGRASLSGPLVHPLEKLLSFAGVGMDRFGEDPADGVRVEADLGEQFVTWVGMFEVEVTGRSWACLLFRDCSSRHRDRETVSLFPAGRLPGPCFPLTRRTVTGPGASSEGATDAGSRSPTVRGLRPRPAVVEHGPARACVRCEFRVG